MSIDFQPGLDLEQIWSRSSNLRPFREDCENNTAAEEAYERELRTAILDYRFGPEEIPRLRQLRGSLEMEMAEVQRIHARALCTLFPVNETSPWITEHRRFLKACLHNLE
jgi:hypothetical protein